MKAKPVKLIYAVGYENCTAEEATHVELNIPGPTGTLYIPVQTSGTRSGTGNWTWNGSVDKPTLRPSVLTQGSSLHSREKFVCHSWINDGQVQFLDDCTHDLRNTTVDLLDVE